METREKCEQIISLYNGRALTGSTQPLVVKFADGGGSRRKTNLSSPDPAWSNHGSTDGSVSIYLERSSVDNRPTN